ncbi:MAG TPA: DNA polymerase III subunit delta [Gemmatimonadaceae bacterium]|jgi:DNA polymerase-3 subunit delta
MASAGERALHAALKSRTFDPVYVLFGEDEFRKDAAVRELMDAAVDPSTRDFNLEVRRGGELTAEALDALLSTPPMLAERRVAVIRDVDKLKKDVRGVLDRYLKRPASDLLLLLVAPAGAKLDKGFTSRGTAVEFEPLTGDRLPRWVTYHAEHELGRPITPEATALLIEAVGPDLAQLALELEKLASYATETIDEHAVSDVVGVRRGESLGDLLDAVAAKDATQALALLSGVLQQPKTTAVSIVMNLTTQTLALAYGVAARDRGTPPRALFNEYMALLKETGAFPGRPWGEAVNAWTKHTERWSAAELDAALAALLATDAALKETRLSSPEQLLATLVLRLCGAGSSRRAA